MVIAPVYCRRVPFSSQGQLPSVVYQMVAPSVLQRSSTVAPRLTVVPLMRVAVGTSTFIIVLSTCVVSRSTGSVSLMTVNSCWKSLSICRPA